MVTQAIPTHIMEKLVNQNYERKVVRRACRHAEQWFGVHNARRIDPSLLDHSLDAAVAAGVITTEAADDAANASVHIDATDNAGAKCTVVADAVFIATGIEVDRVVNRADAIAKATGQRCLPAIICHRITDDGTHQAETIGLPVATVPYL